MASHLQKAQQALKEVESALQAAASEFGTADLSKAQETMRALDADLAQAMQALSISNSGGGAASVTSGGSTILTPGTSVTGDASGSGSGGGTSGGAQLTVPPAPGKGPRKLTLAQRKELRDVFGDKMGGFNERFTALLGTPWTVHVDTANVLSYLPDTEENFGHLLASFYEGATNGVDDFLKNSAAEDDARAAINRAAHHHVVTVEPGAETAIAACDFADGKLRLLFKAGESVWGPGGCVQYLGEALHVAESRSMAAPAPNAPADADFQQLPFLTRYGIKKDYTAEIAAVEATCKEQIGKPISFEPNFVANFAALQQYAASKASRDEPLEDDWQKELGRATFHYFEAFAQQLKDDRFDDDDMLQEGFQEAVDKAKVTLRVVSKSELKEKNATGELTIEDGVVVLRAPHYYWGRWVRSVASNLLSSL